MYKRLSIPSHAQNMHVGHFSEEVIFRALPMILGTLDLEKAFLSNATNWK